MLELALEVAERMGRLPLDVLLMDLEGHYMSHISYALSVMDRPEIRPWWVCLPMSMENGVSQYEPWWIIWDETQQERWVRPMPDRPYVIHAGNLPDGWDWWRRGMPFEEFIIRFADWFGQGAASTSCLVGIRADESMNRYRAVVNASKVRWGGANWTTKVQDCKSEVYNCYPIYDWRTEDLWTYIGRKGCNYNRLYDLMYKAGRSIHEMRICQPYGFEQRKGLDLFQVCEPEIWDRAVQRVAGANFGAIYRGGTVMGNVKVELPAGHSWLSYTRILLGTMPPELREHYLRRINVYLKWWARELGRPVKHLHSREPGEEYDEAGMLVIDIPGEREMWDKYPSHGGPNWRRVAATLIKNDYYCKNLVFSINQKEWDKMEAIKAKYKDL